MLAQAVPLGRGRHRSINVMDRVRVTGRAVQPRSPPPTGTVVPVM